jgi:predicted phosphodiesterase
MKRTFNSEDIETDLGHLSNHDMMEKYRVSQATVTKWRTRYQVPSPVSVGRPSYVSGRIPGSTTPEWNNYPVIESKRCLVISDVEIPDHDSEVLELALAVIEKYQIDTVIFNGDIIALDSYSKWAKSTAYRRSLEAELDPAEQILEQFSKAVPQIKWISGNHERRIALTNDGNLHLGMLLDKWFNIKFSQYSRCVLNPGPEQWFIVHQKEYRRIALSVARDLFQVHLCNIVAAHGHHQALGKDRSGRYWLVEGGSGRDPNRTLYKNVRDTTHPAWNLGFTVILDGEPLLLNKGNAHLYLENFGIKKEKSGGKK